MRKCCWRYTGKHFTHIFFFPLANNKKTLLPILVYKIRKETTSKKTLVFFRIMKKKKKNFPYYKHTNFSHISRQHQQRKNSIFFQILVSVLKAKDIENSKKIQKF